MKPEAFFEFAVLTLQTNPSPAGCRSVTSRAYYAALHKSVEFLGSMEIQLPSGASIHARVPDILVHATEKDISEIAAMLRVLRLQRNEADYNLTNAFVESQEFAATRLEDARKIIGRLSTCMLGRNRPGSTFEAVRPAIVAQAEFLVEGPR